MMHYISDILYWISTGLLVPVIVLLIVVFWIFAIKAFNYYTSIEYLSQYWQRKYGVG